MKFWDAFALILLLAVAMGGKLYRDGLQHPPPDRRPDPRQFLPSVARAPAAPGVSGAPLPPESRSDPNIFVKVGIKHGNVSGTAFSVDRSGIWVTARHVTSGCDLVGLQTPDGRLVRVRRIAEQRDSDISVLWTLGGAPALPVVEPALHLGEDGYSFGFPKGEPGDVYARIIGRRRMMARGRYDTEEPVIAWTQIRRVPDHGADLSGISGGPWVNVAGEVIGVHVAGAPRRGRSYSTAPHSLRVALRRTGVRGVSDTADLPPATFLTPVRFETYGEELRQKETVAKVYCLVGEQWRRLARHTARRNG